MIAPVVTPEIPWSLENVIVCTPEDREPTLDILIPIPISVSNVSTVSLVTLFFKSFVVTCPRGNLFAKVFVASGESFGLSRSNCGYKSVTFCPYLVSVNSSDIGFPEFKG